MANMFALILVIATLVTGILWCVDMCAWHSAQHRGVGHRFDKHKNIGW